MLISIPKMQEQWWQNFGFHPVIFAGWPEIILPPREESGPFLLETEAAISTLNPEAQELFQKFLAASDFKFLEERIEKFSHLPLLKRSEKEKGFQQELAGFVFELVSFYYLGKELGEDLVLLSPQQTYDLYAFLYSGCQIPEDNFLNPKIKGITVPDGLLLETKGKETAILGVCEYTLSVGGRSELPRKQKQRRHYLTGQVIEDFFPSRYPFRRSYLGEYLKKQFPQLSPVLTYDFAQFWVIYVIPKTNESFLKIPPNHLPQIEIMTTPFSGQEFNQVVGGIFFDVRKAIGLRTPG